MLFFRCLWPWCWRRFSAGARSQAPQVTLSVLKLTDLLLLLQPAE